MHSCWAPACWAPLRRAGPRVVDFLQACNAATRNAHVPLTATSQSQLRAQLISQLKKGQLLRLEPPGAEHPPAGGLKQRALNSMLLDYLKSAQYTFTLSVFSEESGAGCGAVPSLTEAEALDVLRVHPDSLLAQAFRKAKGERAGQRGSSVLLHLLEAVAEVQAFSGPGRGAPPPLDTAKGQGTGAESLNARMQQLEREFEQRLAAQRLTGPQVCELVHCVQAVMGMLRRFLLLLLSNGMCVLQCRALRSACRCSGSKWRSRRALT